MAPRLLRRSWWWWWCSASLGSLITSFTSGWSSGPSRWTRPPSCYGWPPTAWRTATHLSTRSSTPSCQRTSGRLTSRCSNARSEPVTPRSTPSRRSAAKQTRRPRLTAPTFDWQGADGDAEINYGGCHTETQCKVRVAEASDISGCVDVLMYGCLDIATAVLFHISAVHYTWMRGS